VPDRNTNRRILSDILTIGAGAGASASTGEELTSLLIWRIEPREDYKAARLQRWI
jgi:hypothetical protein